MMALKAPVIVPTREKALERIIKLPEDIKFIRERNDLSYGQLAATLGVTKQAVFNWEKGLRSPEEPLIWLSFIMWADSLRNSPS